MTPPEIGRIGNRTKWDVRWFPNKFPAVDENGSGRVLVSEKYYFKKESFGYHEVIAETSDHSRQLADLSIDEIKKVLSVYSIRMNKLLMDDRVKYIQIFKNSGVEAGTSLEHSHSQIITVNVLPKLIKEKVEALKAYDRCPYCDIVKKEEKSRRFIYSNGDFTAFAPYAPRFNYEVWIFPRKHYRNITELCDEEFKSLALVFKVVLSKLGRVNAPYNFYLHYSPKGEDLHFCFEITPRMNLWAGFELATSSYIVTTSPEDAAKFYRE